jgi:hypothetical protein
MKTNLSHPSRFLSLALVITLGASTTFSFARPGRGVSVNRNVNRNVNINRNSNVRIDRDIDRRVNVHRDVDIRRDIDIDIDRHRHGGFVAGAVAGTVAGIAIGAAVAAPPRGYRTVYVGASPYAYYGGTFYRPASSGYVVVAPPVGVVVPMLPPGAVVTTVNGVTVYVVNNVYYQPVFASGVTQYRVVVF